MNPIKVSETLDNLGRTKIEYRTKYNRFWITELSENEYVLTLFTECGSFIRNKNNVYDNYNMAYMQMCIEAYNLIHFK